MYVDALYKKAYLGSLYYLEIKQTSKPEDNSKELLICNLAINEEADY